MQKEIFENLNKISQQTLENFKKIGEANLKLSEKLLQEQIQLTTALIETTTGSAEEISGTKDVKDFASIQADLIQSYNQKLTESARKYTDILTEAGKFYNGIFETNLKSANDFGKKTAQGASKAA